MSHMQQFDIQPHILTRFSILKKIGSGAYGHVWKVQEKSTRKIYALKKIFDAFQHATDAQRTYRQIQVLKQLSHPNIIRLYETLKAQNNKDVYLIFQYMEADLHNVIAQGILKEVHIRFIIYQLAKALKYMHSGLIIHRDLKPSNILINSNCSIKLCDFGLVRTLMRQGESNSILTQGVATRWYRAPEVLFGSTSYSTPADIWSFGCIIYEILVQKPMFPGESTTDQLDKIISYTGYPTDEQLRSMKSQQARGMLKQSKIHFYTPNIKQTLKDLPPLLGQLIKKMTALNPKERITIEQILNHEVVQPFRKKEQQIQCQKIISLGVSDDKKLTVDEYRDLVYGIKTIQSRDSVKFMSSAKKSLSSTQISQNYPKFSTPLDHKYQLKYVKSKQLLNYNNKSVQLQTSEYSKFKEQKTADSRKDILFDPTRLTYISKTFYTPKNYNSSSTPSQASQKTQGSWHGYPQSQNSSIMTTNSYKQMPHTTTSSSSGYTKPMLFKSSKYVIHKTEQSQKDHK